MTADRARWSAIAHAGMAIMNPIGERRLDAMLDRLRLAPADRVLDLGCGRGELLVRLAERYGCGGLGIDRSAELLEDARRAAATRAPAAALRFLEGDVREPGEGGFAAAASVGAAVDGYAATLARLRDRTRPGGLVLLGEGYWRQPPTRAYLDAFGAARDELASYRGMLAAGEAAGLEPVAATRATRVEWDAYERRWAENGERHARAHAGEPGAAELLAGSATAAAVTSSWAGARCSASGSSCSAGASRG